MDPIDSIQYHITKAVQAQIGAPDDIADYLWISAQPASVKFVQIADSGTTIELNRPVAIEGRRFLVGWSEEARLFVYVEDGTPT